MKFIGVLKWILAILGTARANIIGGFIGYIIGYTVEEYIKNNLSIEFSKTFENKKLNYSVFQNRLLALISEVIRADGYIHKEEIYFVKNYLLRQFGSDYSNKMLKTLKLQVEKRFNVKDISLKLKENIDRNEKIKILTFLHGITLQSGRISSKEELLIKNISNYIGLSNQDYLNFTNNKYNKQKKQSTKTKSKVFGYNAYKILDVLESATDAEVKKAYRKMVLKFHPDKTDIDDNIANEKFSEISEAYHLIKKKRGIK